jgi:TetR/AcrR family transcriptional regulator, cholesterol catabolism regulator
MVGPREASTLTDWTVSVKRVYYRPMPLRRTARTPLRARRAGRRRADETITDTRRREIFAEAVRLMEEKGFAAMSVQHIADALEFSKANFYHHIDSKEQLLYDIFVDTLEYSLRHIEEIVSSDRSIPDQLRALVEFYLSLMFDRRATMLVWFRERAHLSDAHQKDIGRLEQQIGATLEGLYSKGMAAGYFKTMRPDVLRMAIFGMCFQLTKLARPDRAAAAEITRQVQNLACTGLLTSNREP